MLVRRLFGEDRRSVRSAAVHTLWTVVWTCASRGPQECGGARESRAGANRGSPGRPGPQGSGRGRGGRRGMAETTLDLATVWDQIRERLATSLSPQQNAMLNLTRPVGLFEDTAVLEAPNEFTQTVLESRMRRVLAEALSQRFGRDIRVAVQVEDAPPSAVGEPQDDEPVRRPWAAVAATRVEEEDREI